MKTKPQAWFFGTEPPTPVAPWGVGGPSRKMLLGLGAGFVVLLIGGGAVAAVTHSSDGSNPSRSAGSVPPMYSTNDDNGTDNDNGPVFGGGETSTTPLSTIAPTPPTSSNSPSSAYQFPDFISAPTDSAAPFTGDPSVLGVWEGQVTCGSTEVGMLLQASGAGGDHVTGFWDAYSLSGPADLASSGAGMVGLADGGHLAIRSNQLLVGGGTQAGVFDGTLSADGNDLTGPMSGCGTQPIDLRKQQLLSGAQDPLLGEWSDGQGGTWTFTSTGAGRYTGTQSRVSGCATMYKFTLTGFNDHYAGQAAPQTNAGCTIPILTDLAAVNISSQDGSAVVELNGTPKLTLTRTGGGASPTGTAAASSASTSAGPSATPSSTD